MNALIFQPQPHLCVSEGEFITCVNNDIERLVQEHHPDLIVFPEAIGLWMCMMKPVSWLSRLFYRFLPSHRVVAESVFSIQSAAITEQQQYEILTSMQFSRPTPMLIQPQNIKSRHLGMWDEYREDFEVLYLKKQSYDCNIKHWLTTASNWLFERIRLPFIAQMLRSKEQFAVYKQAFSSAAQKHGVYIQAGSLFVKQLNGSIKNNAYTFSPDGKIISIQSKIHPIAFEKMMGIVGGNKIETFEVNGVTCGVAICADVNFPNDHVHNLKQAGCEFIACPSGGLVPTHAWQWDFDTEIKNAHWARSQEENVIIGRSYNAGDLIPHVLMFQGRSSITAPQNITDDDSGVVALVDKNNIEKECSIDCQCA